MRTHQDLDQRSLALHRLVAQKVRRDPSLFARADAILRHWRAIASPRTHAYLDEWRRLIDAGADACLAVAEEDSERAAALRQASPLACLLTNEERFRFLKEWRARHAQG
jgi:hypothetical protein